jgi:hypothetical protein
MVDPSHKERHIQYVTNFQDFVSASFHGDINAICWSRTLQGDFSEILKQVALTGDITEIGPEEICNLSLSEQGRLAREILLNDLNILTANGASPIINVIKCYERDDAYPFLPTDVYSFHVDRSPIPTETILCTYYGAPSEILPNAQGQKKVLVPEIRNKLRKLYQGAEDGFESFLSEHFFDLHYEASPDAYPISLGIGNMWRLAVDHPESQVSACIHRAPDEHGQPRLLMIC